MIRDMLDFTVTTDNIFGAIKGFPVEVVELIVRRAFEQGATDKCIVLSAIQKSIYDGFTWGETIEGSDFWSNVICCKNWKLFFEKYPVYKEDKVIYDVVVPGGGFSNEIFKYTGVASSIALRGQAGDLYCAFPTDKGYVLRFAKFGTTRYKKVLQNGISIHKIK